MRQASKALCGRKASGFILWCYLAMNQDSYQFALSNEAVLDAMGLKKDAYDTAVSLLTAEGYLVQENGNQWAFYEIPRSKDGSTHNEKVGSTHFSKQVQPTRNITEDITNNITTMKSPPPEGDKLAHLPTLRRSQIDEMGLTNFSIDGEIFISSTGKAFRLID